MPGVSSTSWQGFAIFLSAINTNNLGEKMKRKFLIRILDEDEEF